MYQEWESPPFDVGKLLEICKEFFGGQNFPASVEQKKRDKWVIQAQIAPISKVQTLIVERKGKKIRLTFVPIGHAEDGLTRLGGLLVSGRVYKTMTRNQIFLDGVENQFWENLDRKIVQLAPKESERL